MAGQFPSLSLKPSPQNPRVVSVGVRNGTGSASLLRARDRDEPGSRHLPGTEAGTFTI